MINPEDAELTFRRLYIEKTTFRYSKDEQKDDRRKDLFRARVDVATAMWFCNGTIFLMCGATETELNFEGDPTGKPEFLEPLETAVHHHFVQSEALRLAIAAHDRLVANVLAKLPKDAERTR